MKKAVFIPDSFKGTMSSKRICELMADTVHRQFPECETVCVPVADGGEGSVDAFVTALGGEKVFVTVSDPFFIPMRSFYGLIDNGRTAVIEMAACAGLPLVGDRKDPSVTTTYGVGELIRDAAERGVKRIIVGLGGSCTNDAGCGAAAAVGVVFRDKAGREFVPVGGTLKDIAVIDKSGIIPELSAVEIVTMCDIDNPMYGETGAAYIFAPQKGADETAVRELDDGLRHLASLLGDEISLTPGSGAAGAMGAGMLAFFGSRLQMGIETVLDTVGFDGLISDADVIFTGEGKLDSQSLRGKVVIGVARRAKLQGKSVIAVVGGADADIGGVYAEGVKAVFTINRLPLPLSESKAHSEENLVFTMDNILRIL